MITTGIGKDGRPTLRVPYRRSIDLIWLGVVGMLSLNVFIMRDPNATWPTNGRPIPDVIRLPWLWACVAAVGCFVVLLLLRWLTTFPALGIGEGRVLVYSAPYRWFRFAVDDVVSVSEIVETTKRSNARWMVGDRWFAIDYGGAAVAPIGSASTRADIEEVHRQVIALLGHAPTPMANPDWFEVDLGPHPIRRRLGLPVPAPEPACACEDPDAEGCPAPDCLTRAERTYPLSPGGHEIR